MRGAGAWYVWRVPQSPLPAPARERVSDRASTWEVVWEVVEHEVIFRKNYVHAWLVPKGRGRPGRCPSSAQEHVVGRQLRNATPPRAAVSTFYNNRGPRCASRYSRITPYELLLLLSSRRTRNRQDSRASPSARLVSVYRRTCPDWFRADDCRVTRAHAQ